MSAIFLDDSRKRIRKLEKEVRHGLKVEAKLEVKSKLEKDEKDLKDEMESLLIAGTFLLFIPWL